MWKTKPFENREEPDNNRESNDRAAYSYGRPAKVRADPRFDSPNFMPRPRTDKVALSMGDADNAPQAAVGGIREVEELLNKDPARVHRVLFRHMSGNPKLYTLQKIAKKNHIHVQQVEAKILDSYAMPNQGIVALCHEKGVLTWDEVKQEFYEAKEKGLRKVVAVATNIEDPRNLGACIRSGLALGVDILLIPSKGMCGITPTVSRAAAGALEKLRICRPDNLEATVGELKLAGYQILGLDAVTDTSLADFPFEEQIVLAVGGEDVGLPPFIRKQCDAVLRIPMKPDAHSYNASVALSLGLYEFARKRI